jgi:hypothetical protein
MPHDGSKPPSALRTRILEEAKAANGGIRKKPARTWTKKPKYGNLQSTFDLDAGMRKLRPSRQPLADVQALSPENFVSLRKTSSSCDEDAVPSTPPWTEQRVGGHILQQDHAPKPMDFKTDGLERTLLSPQQDNHIPAYGMVDCKDDHVGYTSYNTMLPSNVPYVEEVMDDYFFATRTSTLDICAPIMLEADELAIQSHLNLDSTANYNWSADLDYNVAHSGMAEWHTSNDAHKPPLHTTDPIMLELDAILEQSRMHAEVPPNGHEERGQSGSTLQTPSSTQWMRGSSSERGVLPMRAQFSTTNHTRARDSSIATPIDPTVHKFLFRPDSPPISREQLAAEVKSLYAGLTLVESKCIHVDKAQAEAMRYGDSRISNDHWQALIALHKTLLHEYHDFFLASQHPRASPALRQLASKYAMPTRMWKRGIQTILALFRLNRNGRAEHIQEFLCDTMHIMNMFQENLPGMADDWNKIEAALSEFQNVVCDLRKDTPYYPPNSGSSSDNTSSRIQSYLQYLHTHTQPQGEARSNVAPEYGDVFINDLSTIPPDRRHEEIFCFPQRVTDTLMAWLIMGQAICCFNIFTKVFALLSIAAWRLHVPSTLF